MKMKMKAMVFAREVVKQRLATLMAWDGIEVVGTSNVPEAMILMGRNRVDIAVIDELVDESEFVCRCLSRLGNIPVVLTVSQGRVDWDRVQSLGVDGYIPEEGGNCEIMARLRAVVRRVARVEHSWREPRYLAG